MDKEDRKGIDTTFFLNKHVALFVYDKDRVVRRDGILKGFDHTHYHLLITFEGSHKGQVLSYLRNDVKRIVPIEHQNRNQKGGFN